MRKSLNEAEQYRILIDAYQSQIRAPLQDKINAFKDKSYAIFDTVKRQISAALEGE